jgi:RimJ/RimL family protein N-acetyltransferase
VSASVTDIRLLTPADAAAYAELRTLMLGDTPWAFSASPENDRGRDASGVAASLTRPHFAIAGAFEGERLLACAMTNREERPKRAHIAWIMSVYTRPEARGRGLGRRVVALAVDTARSWSGVESVQLGVSERSPDARRLYESLGFRAWGVEPDAIRINGTAFSEVHMHLDLRLSTPRSTR